MVQAIRRMNINMTNRSIFLIMDKINKKMLIRLKVIYGVIDINSNVQFTCSFHQKDDNICCISLTIVNISFNNKLNW